jgi:hypothetical protein
MAPIYRTRLVYLMVNCYAALLSCSPQPRTILKLFNLLVPDLSSISSTQSLADMDELLARLTEEVKAISGTADEQLRRRTIDTLRDLQYSLETPEETMQRVIYMVCHSILKSSNLNLLRDTESNNSLHTSLPRLKHFQHTL